MNDIIRQESQTDYAAVFSLVEQAFKELKISNHDEQFLVERLRKSKSFVPELSLVAEVNGQIVGHILLTRAKIKSTDQVFMTLGLAPVAVLPEFQNKRIGSRLIEEAHRIARELGFTSVVLVGHADYYPRFGYKKASDFGIRFPIEVPDECGMVAELADDALKGISGVIEHPKEFF